MSSRAATLGQFVSYSKGGSPAPPLGKHKMRGFPFFRDLLHGRAIRFGVIKRGPLNLGNAHVSAEAAGIDFGDGLGSLDSHRGIA